MISEDIIVLGEHNHGMVLGFIEKAKNRENIKNDALTNIDKNPNQIISHALTGKRLSQIRATGTLDSCKKFINRARNNNIKPEDIFEQNLNIPEELTRTKRGFKFLQFSKLNCQGIEPKFNIVIFFSENHRNSLHEHKIWSIDGTFYVSPKPWLQLFTISYIEDHHVVPIIYGLLPSKSQRVYEFFIYVVKTLIPDLNPDV